MIIDFHVHVFPDKIAERAISELTEHSGGVSPHYDGTVKKLTEYMTKAGVKISIALNIATKERQQQTVNNFAKETNEGSVVSFGSVYPLSSSAVDELYRIKEMGLKGIKLHPDYQNFFVDDERVFKIYETAAKLGLITVFHAGIDIGLFNPVHATPERIANALPCFNGAPVVAAHFGGYMQWDGVQKYLVGKDIYFDTSYCYSRMPYIQAKDILKSHGADKILYGSDMPWSAMKDEIRFVEAISENDEQKHMILGENARKLLKF